MMKVLAFGEVLFDVINGEKFLGGAPLNFAAHFRQCGGESAIYSRVGNDQDGSEGIRQIENLGVDINFIQIDHQHPTGLVNVQLDNGQPSYHIETNVAYDFINPDEIDLSNYEAFYFGTLCQRNLDSRNALYELLRENDFKEIFYDVNLRKDCFTKQVIVDSLGFCTILKLNDDEVFTLSELIWSVNLSMHDFTKRVFNSFGNIEMIVITQGAKGCTIFTKEDRRSIEIPAFKADVKDTVGAGDSFSASFLYYYSKGLAINLAGQIANRIAAFVASSDGPTPVYHERLKTEIEILKQNDLTN